MSEANGAAEPAQKSGKRNVGRPKAAPKNSAKNTSAIPSPDRNATRVFVPFDKITADEEWNARGKHDEDDAESKRKDEEMIANMLARLESGDDLQIVDVGFRGPYEDGSYFLRYGYRRRRCMLKLKERGIEVAGMWGLAVEATTIAVADRKADYLANMGENHNRHNLRPHQSADQWHRYLKDYPEENASTLAKSIGLSKSHVQNMVRLREKLCPELWDEFVKKGEEMKVRLLLKACQLKADKQVDAYEEFRKAEAGGRPLAEGKKEKPRAKNPDGSDYIEEDDADPKELKKAADTLGLDFKTIEAWMKEAEAAEAKDAGEFAEGAAYALRCLLEIEPGGWDHKRLYGEGDAE